MGEGREVLASTNAGDLQQVSHSVETAGKLLAICFGLLYLTGFLIVTFHLSRYGILSLSLVRTQYVIAGLYMFVPCWVIFLSVAAIFRILAADKDWFLQQIKRRKLISVTIISVSRILDVASVVFWIFIGFVLVLYFFSIRPVGLSGWILLRIVVVIMFFGGLVHGAVLEAAAMIRNPQGYFSATKVFSDLMPRTVFLLVF